MPRADRHGPEPFGQRDAPEDAECVTTLHRCCYPASSGRCSCPPRSGHCSGAPSGASSGARLARSPALATVPGCAHSRRNMGRWRSPTERCGEPTSAEPTLERSPAAGFAAQQCQGSCASRSGRGLSAYVESRLSAVRKPWLAPQALGCAVSLGPRNIAYIRVSAALNFLRPRMPSSCRPASQQRPPATYKRTRPVTRRWL